MVELWRTDIHGNEFLIRRFSEPEEAERLRQEFEDAATTRPTGSSASTQTSLRTRPPARRGACGCCFEADALVRTSGADTVALDEKQ